MVGWARRAGTGWAPVGDIVVAVKIVAALDNFAGTVDWAFARAVPCDLAWADSCRAEILAVARD